MGQAFPLGLLLGTSQRAPLFGGGRKLDDFIAVVTRVRWHDVTLKVGRITIAIGDRAVLSGQARQQVAPARYSTSGIWSRLDLRLAK
jgi:hypothetical protein